MLVFAGNPVLSTPGGARLDEAMEQLEWCVAVDMYVTETTRHADVILPPLAHLERSDVDIVFPALSVRNQIRYNPAAVPGPSDGKTDWEILLALAAPRRPRREGSRDQRGCCACSARSPRPSGSSTSRCGPGPYGRLRSRRALDVAKVKRAPHGIDLGPLEPSLLSLLRTKDKRVQLAPAGDARRGGPARAARGRARGALAATATTSS